ncbi:AAA family ATPase [Veillonella sp.]|uniref:ATP-dependent nuclease n=1 Tax=Veillonella sp. TaxID=1926307 RepID=UPI0025D8FAFF|nr:AAA family ATPase [Veillonella sp.]
MIRIVKCSISRYRSILSMTLDISQESNSIAICGPNNVGKTNTLRAINLFFYPEDYVREIDMPKIKSATGGQSTHPKIELTFWDEDRSRYYVLCRDMKVYSENSPETSLTGFSYEPHNKKNKLGLSSEEVLELFGKMEFVYIESINTFIPELIRKITDGMIDVEYDKSRLSKSKRKLKEAYDTYVDGLSQILGTFANDISDTFRHFRENWKVEFVVPKNSETFKDLVSKDVKLSLNDNGSIGVLDKGAGLQRLATILLNFEMLSRLDSKKNIFVCIDEPDAYLHEGLQRKLKRLFDEKNNSMQLFFTTHSKIFINEYNMQNVFLLNSKYYEKFSTRKKKNINVMETEIVDINEQNGYDQICSHLGIEPVTYELLQCNNILVEGNCDKKYLTELIKFFGFDCPNIESLNGADNAIKYLEFYNSYYHNNTSKYKPKIKIIFDNDPKGREIYNKIRVNNYQNIEVKSILINNHMNTGNINVEHNNTNNEIEDFMYPEVMVFLINLLLQRKNMAKLNKNKICRKVHTRSFSIKGILELCEYEKNSVNPDKGAEISFISSGNQTNRIKEGLAGMFNLEANKPLLSLLAACNVKYPYVKEALNELCTF